jgi:hypothetical protein
MHCLARLGGHSELQIEKRNKERGDEERLNGTRYAATIRPF